MKKAISAHTVRKFMRNTTQPLYVIHASILIFATILSGREKKVVYPSDSRKLRQQQMSRQYSENEEKRLQSEIENLENSKDDLRSVGLSGIQFLA